MTADDRTGYDLREGAAMIAERAMLPDRVLVRAVTFLYEVPHEPGSNSRYDVLAKGSVDRYGHVSLEPSIPWHGEGRRLRELMNERRADMAEALIDAGLAEWRAVGQGDSELYATQEWLRQLAPALSSLPDGWQAWPA